MALLSLRAYARHRAELGLPGTSHKAVQKAVAAGRIRLSPDGKVDSDEADRLWAANTDESQRRNLAQEGRTAPVPRAPRPEVERPAPPAVPEAEPPAPDGGVPDYAASRARREAAEAALAELELGEKRGQLASVREIDARLANEYARAKTKLLAVPSKLRQRDPSVTLEQVELLDALIREVLNDLASEEDAPVREPEAAA
jgi:hypothetical protein